MKFLFAFLSIWVFILMIFLVYPTLSNIVWYDPIKIDQSLGMTTVLAFIVYILWFLFYGQSLSSEIKK